MQIEGIIKLINDEQVISDKFKKREFVVTTNDDQYPQDILIETTQDKTDLLDAVSEGNSVKVSINIRGREWTNPKTGEIKYFNTIQAWKIEAEANTTMNAAPAETADSNSDDLPF